MTVTAPTTPGTYQNSLVAEILSSPSDHISFVVTQPTISFTSSPGPIVGERFNIEFTLSNTASTLITPVISLHGNNFSNLGTIQLPMLYSDSTSGIISASAPITAGSYTLSISASDNSYVYASDSKTIIALPFVLSDVSGNQSFMSGTTNFKACFAINALAHVSITTNWGFSDLSDFGIGTNCFTLPVPSLPSDYTYSIKAVMSANSLISDLFLDTLRVTPAPEERKNNILPALLGAGAGLCILLFGYQEFWGKKGR